MKKILVILLCLLCLTGCREVVIQEGGKRHICTVKRDKPMPGVSYCEWNYARGYADGLEWMKDFKEKE